MDIVIFCVSPSHRDLLDYELETEEDHHADTTLRIMAISIAVSLAITIAILLLMLCCRSNRALYGDFPRIIRTSPAESELPNQNELAGLPVFIFGAQAPTSSLSASVAQHCSICLDEYVHGVRVRILPRCKHMFHKDCVDPWLLSHSSFCPICRHTAMERSCDNLDQ